MCLIIIMMLCCCCCRGKKVIEEEATDGTGGIQEPLERTADPDAEGLDTDELNDSIEYPEESVNVGI